MIVEIRRLRSQILTIFYLIVLGLLLFGLQHQPSLAAEQSAADWPMISLVKITDGFASPIYITHAGDSSGRVFVVEQAGRIQILKGGDIQTTPFLDITDRVSSPNSGGGGEEGLLSVAFPPGYASKGYFYVYYTNKDGNNVVARFHRTADPDVADPSSEELILLLEHPIRSNHNGGQLAFGPDGYLYIGTGDGGGGGDPDKNAQNPASLLGKLLRIDVELVSVQPPNGAYMLYLPLIVKPGEASPGSPYAVPPDNPFVGVSGYRKEIWAFGLRNPWRFSFDQQTGDLYLGDVGQGLWEEVDFQVASSPGGENYGWNIMEGAHCYNSETCDQTGLVLPVAEYSHTLGCSISGGYVYRGNDYASMKGVFLYGDFCSGRIWGLQQQGGSWQSSELLDSPYNIASFGVDQAGELYLTNYYDGEIYRVQAAP